MNPDDELELKVFHGRILREDSGDSVTYKLPTVREVDEAAVMKQFEGVKSDVRVLMAGEVERVEKGEVAVKVAPPARPNS